MTGDQFDDVGDPGLRALFLLLTSDPTPDELSSEHEALAMFRSVNSQPDPLRSRRSRPRRSRSRVGGRLVAAGAALAVFGGFAAAAYAEVLPAPLQRLAHDLIGAPNRPPVRPTVSPSRPAGSVSRSAGRSSHSRSPSAPSQSGRSPSSHPSSPSPSAPPGSPSLTITAARQIPAGDSVRITASLSYGGRPAADVKLGLTELPAGRGSQWRVVDQAATGPQGSAVFTVASLTTNASFRVTGPNQIASGELSIVVIPSVSLNLAPGHPKHSDLLLASAPLAQRGDAVQLEEETSAAGPWQLVFSHRLRKTGQAEFSVVARKISVTYRVVLLATAQHGQSVSMLVTVPARGQGRGTG